MLAGQLVIAFFILEVCGNILENLKEGQLSKAEKKMDKLKDIFGVLSKDIQDSVKDIITATEERVKAKRCEVKECEEVETLMSKALEKAAAQKKKKRSKKLV